jgi:hypothetical protein
MAYVATAAPQRPTRYVTLNLFEQLTGYTVKAVRRKIEDRVWLEGFQFRRGPDGRILVDLEGFERWVEKRR